MFLMVIFKLYGNGCLSLYGLEVVSLYDLGIVSLIKVGKKVLRDQRFVWVIGMFRVFWCVLQDLFRREMDGGMKVNVYSLGLICLMKMEGEVVGEWRFF